jgi:MoaA/NifB/PqqE/SkfB family radical SAM enzyme
MAVLCLFYLIVVVFFRHGEPLLSVTILVTTDVLTSTYVYMFHTAGTTWKFSGPGSR